MYKVYGKSNCPNCVKAKDLLDSKGLSFEYVNLEEDTKSLEMVKGLGFRSVPVVFSGEDVVGGFKELEKRLIN